MIIHHPAPDPLNGQRLADEIGDALGVDPEQLNVVATIIDTAPSVTVTVSDGTDEQQVRAVIDAHTGEPTEGQAAHHATVLAARQAVETVDGLVDKARLVADGRSLFTPDETQQILAAFVLHVTAADLP